MERGVEGCGLGALLESRTMAYGDMSPVLVGSEIEFNV